MSLPAKPYHLFALAAVLLIMLSFIKGNHPFDVPVQGTSYVLDYAHTLRALAMLLLLLWILYMATIRFLFSTFLVWLHIIITLVLLIAIVFLFFRFNRSVPHDFADEPVLLSFQQKGTIRMIVPGLIFLLVLTQLSYILNLLFGIMRKLNKS